MSDDMFAVVIAGAFSLAGAAVLVSVCLIVAACLAFIGVTTGVSQNDQNKDRIARVKQYAALSAFFAVAGCVVLIWAHYSDKSGDDDSDSDGGWTAKKIAGYGFGGCVYIASAVLAAMAMSNADKLKKESPKTAVQ
jgi:hypothetical protein